MAPDHNVELFAGLLAVVAAIALAAEKLRIPYPILLVLGGLGLGGLGLIFAPDAPPAVTVAPHVVFYVFLPPLLYWAGVMTSWRDFVANIRPILLLAVGLVVATTFAVGGVGYWLIPSLGFAGACVLGAIVSPPDAIAATSVIERLRVPRRIVSILEGESLVNDATALVALAFAVEAVQSGYFSLPAAGGRFVILATGGIAIGLAVGWIVTQIRRRLHEPHVDGIVSLLTPFFAYLPAEVFHFSGVLAVVTTGIYISRQLPRSFTADARMRQAAVWDALVFLLNGAVFILIGLQLPTVVGKLDNVPQLIGYAAIISVAAMIVRLAWVFVASNVSERLPFCKHPPGEHVPAGSLFVVGWAGMRGIVSLAAALALPLDFPGRDKIIFITFCVILATLVLQGLSLPLVIRLARFTDDTDGATEERQARLDATHAALSRLNVLEIEEDLDPAVVARIKVEYEQRLHSLGGTMRGAIDPALLEPLRLGNRIRCEMLTAERRMITLLRDQNVIGDDVLRRVLREIDLEVAKHA